MEELRKVHLIWPFLWEISQRHPRLKVWPSIPLDADASQGLTGTPDYLVTKKSDAPESPYCVIMEAKKENFSQGWGQTLAAMKGAQILNTRAESGDIPVYGVVTTGKDWAFGKLEGEKFVTYPPEGVNILENEEKVRKALNILDIIFDLCEQKIF
jgi:hypothetical protein